MGTTVLFDFDSAQLTDYAQRVLDRQAAFMKAQPETRVTIGGMLMNGAHANTTWLWASVVHLQRVITLSQKV